MSSDLYEIVQHLIEGIGLTAVQICATRIVVVWDPQIADPRKLLFLMDDPPEIEVLLDKDNLATHYFSSNLADPSSFNHIREELAWFHELGYYNVPT